MILYFLSSTLISVFAQESEISGMVVIFYTKKTLVTDPRSPDMYCLDSIRLFSPGIALPLDCEYLSNEMFAFIPLEKTSKMINTSIRESKLYCSNPLENYVHRGGEIFINENDIIKLYVSFNIHGKGYYVDPSNNCVNISDSLISKIERNRKEFYDSEKVDYCNQTINYGRYFVVNKIYASSKLTEDQCAFFSFKKTDKIEFLRYGLW